MDDPFTLVYDRLWAMVDRNHDLVNLLKRLNMIRFDSDYPRKVNIADSDLPELALLSEGIETANYQNSSTTSSLTKNYSWLVTTGSFKIKGYNQLAWELYRSMVDWRSELCELEWNTQRFVKNAQILSATEGTLRAEQDRGIFGWSAIWTCQVDMMFLTNSLRIVE